MSNMLDLQQAIGGAPGGGPPGGGPASIQAPSLADEVGFPGGGGGGPAPDDQGGDGGGGGGGSTIDYLDAAEDALHSFIQEDPDEADRAKAAKALQIILDLKAGNQQSVQSGDMKSLQRALQGAGAGGPGA